MSECRGGWGKSHSWRSPYETIGVKPDREFRETPSMVREEWEVFCVKCKQKGTLSRMRFEVGDVVEHE